MSRISGVSPNQFATFGELLKFLRRRAGLTQRELSIAVGYSDTQISRLEQNQRISDQATLSALFIPALLIEKEPEWAARLLELATEARKKVELPISSTSVAEPSLLDRIVRGQLVGRQAELRQLRDLWTRAQQGRAHLALISGEPGIGKTRLAREVLAYARSNRAVVLTGGSYEYEAVVPYLPFIEALREWVEVQSQETLRDVLAPPRPKWRNSCPKLKPASAH